jgi:tetratricopeptide (TPR) repeat protein
MTAQTYYDIGIFLYNKGQNFKAATCFQSVLQSCDQDPAAAESVFLLNTLRNLAPLLEEQGKYMDAERLMERSVKLSTQIYGTEDENTALEMNTLAMVKRGQGKYIEAEKMLIKSLKILEKQGTAQMKYAIVLNNLAGLLEDQKRYHVSKYALWSSFAHNNHNNETSVAIFCTQ